MDKGLKFEKELVESHPIVPRVVIVISRSAAEGAPLPLPFMRMLVYHVINHMTLRHQYLPHFFSFFYIFFYFPVFSASRI